MPRKRFEAILDRLVGHGERLYFHVKGEPLLHPELARFLALAAERGFQVTLTSNGKLLSQRADILLSATNINKLSISLHSQSGSPDEAELWRGTSCFLDKHREQPAFPVSLRLWNLDSGHLPQATFGLWGRLRERYPLLDEWGSPSIGSKSLRLDHRVWLNQAERFAWPDLSLEKTRIRGSCHGLRNQIGILVDGTVVPCCLDGEGAISLGNILYSGLDDILGSVRARSMRAGFEKGHLVEDLCMTCGYLATTGRATH